MTGSAWGMVGDDEATEKVEIAELIPGAARHADLDSALAEHDYASGCLADAIRRQDCLAVEIYASEAVRSWIAANAIWHTMKSAGSSELDPDLLTRAQADLRRHHRVLVGLFLDGGAKLTAPVVTRLFEQLRGRLADEVVDEDVEMNGQQ